MPSEYLLDTNAVIHIFHYHPGVRSRMDLHRPSRFPFITVAELLYGAKRSARAQENLRVYREFLSRYDVLYPNLLTLEIHSDLRLSLAKAGRPIPDNDLWQAAIAIQHDAILVTNDRHFAAIHGLRTEDWAI